MSDTRVLTSPAVRALGNGGSGLGLLPRGGSRALLAEDAGGRSIQNDSYAGALVEKWAPYIDVKGEPRISDPWQRRCTAFLFENQVEELTRAKSHYGSLSEETLAANVGPFTKFIFPIVRRVWPNLFANQLVSVQPMTAPVGAIFYMEFVTGTTKGDVPAGMNLIQKLSIAYSSDNVKFETVAVAGIIGANPFVLAFVPVLATTPGSVTFTVISADATPVVSTTTDNGTGGITATAAITAGSINYATGATSITLAAPAGTAPFTIKVSYRYNMEMNPQIPQVNLDLRKTPVEAQTRKLKFIWSAEAADDLKAFHGIEAESELVAQVASEIALEVDRQIVNEIFDAAPFLTDTTTGAPYFFDTTSIPAGVPFVQFIRDILTPITVASNIIHKNTRRGPANWIVTSPEVNSLVQQLSTHGDFRPIFAPEMAPLGAPYEQVGTPGYGMFKSGVIQNRWTLYVDVFFRTLTGGAGGDVTTVPAGTYHVVLLGLKGASFLDTGYVYAPYIPLQVTPTFADPGDFSYRKGMRTRYATKLINTDFFLKFLVKTQF